MQPIFKHSRDGERDTFDGRAIHKIFIETLGRILSLLAIISIQLYCALLFTCLLCFQAVLCYTFTIKSSVLQLSRATVDIKE